MRRSGEPRIFFVKPWIVRSFHDDKCLKVCFPLECWIRQMWNALGVRFFLLFVHLHFKRIYILLIAHKISNILRVKWFWPFEFLKCWEVNNGTHSLVDSVFGVAVAALMLVMVDWLGPFNDQLFQRTISKWTKWNGARVRDGSSFSIQ